MDENICHSFMVRIYCATFNHMYYISDALNGFVIQQTTFPVVYTIVDDASDDRTANVIKQFVNKYFDLDETSGGYDKNTDYGHVTFAQHKINKKCFFAVIYLNENHYSQKKSKAPYLTEWMDTKYVALCEGDDYWTDPLKLQKQVDFMEKHDDIGLCFTDYCNRNQQGELSPPVFRTGVDRIPSGFEDHLLRAGYIAPMSWMWRSSCQDLLSNCKTISDGSFSIALEFYKNSNVAFLEDATCVYRISEGSASRPKTKERQFQYQLGVYKTQLYYADKYKVGLELVEKIKSKTYFEMLPLALETDQKEFIKEATVFFDSKNIYYAGLMGLCCQLNEEKRENLKIEKELLGIRNSNAYRIGKRMTKVFGGIVKKLKKCPPFMPS